MTPERSTPTPPAVDPSHIRGHVTARRVGRPARLTRTLVAEFIGRLALGLHLEHAAALCGIRAPQLSDWLRQGRRDLDAKRDTIAAAFSEAVSAELSRLQERSLAQLELYQRLAEGWSPTCKACTTKRRPCGAHKENLRLAADLVRWKLQHRFPAHWNRSTVSHEVGIGDDGEQATTPTVVAGDEGNVRPVVGLTIFVPQRKPPA